MTRNFLARALAFLALGCADPPPPELLPPLPRQTWRLAGRVGPGEGPGPFAGARALLDSCGEDRPCAAERWVADPPLPPLGAREPLPAEFALVRAGDTVAADGFAGPWRGAWSTLDGVLAPCLGDPLAVPPAGDTGGWRALVFDPDAPGRGEPPWGWVVHLSGDNPCGLSGELRLSATADRALAQDLTCGGSPWQEGGRACARRAWTGILVERARRDWEALSSDERAVVIGFLAQDPETEGIARELRER